jgi:sarcosine oxidase, subunit alpha
MLAADRKQLVGLLTDNPATVLEEGAQLTESANPPVGSRALGHVTSSYASAPLGRSIALALVGAGRSRIGAKLHVPMPGGAVAVTVTTPIFYDKAGARLNG